MENSSQLWKKAEEGVCYSVVKSIPEAKNNTKKCVIVDETKLIHLDDQKFRAFPSEGDSWTPDHSYCSTLDKDGAC